MSEEGTPERLRRQKKTMKTIKAFTKIFLISILISLVVAVIIGTAMASETESSKKADVSEIQKPDEKEAIIKLSFKVDPRVTRGMYMGDRWISPPTYLRVGESKECTVETRAEVLDANGKRMNTSLEWSAADPEMVTVKPDKGNAVNITVKREGESKLKVTSERVSKELLIKAINKGNVIQVEISQ